MVTRELDSLTPCGVKFTWHQEVKTMTQKVNVPTFAEAWRAAMAASVEAHGPQVMVLVFETTAGSKATVLGGKNYVK